MSTKKTRVKTKKRSKTNSKRKKLIKKLDNIFSWIVRLTDGKCITCGEEVETNEKGDPASLQCSHYFKRDRLSTRYLKKNAHAQCKRCHTYHTFQSELPYTRFMVKTYGEDALAAMELLSQKLVKLSIPDLESLYEIMKTEYEEVKNAFHDRVPS